jgi:type VI secretion system protein ImpC
MTFAETLSELPSGTKRLPVAFATRDENRQPAVLPRKDKASAKAQLPLREARIDVAEVAGKPGLHSVVAFLRPHFPLDELTISLPLVAEPPAPVR